MTTKKADTQAGNLEANAPEGLAISDKEQVEARGEGAKEAVKEAAKDAYRFLTDGGQPGEPVTNPYLGSDESQQYAYLLEYGVPEFEKLVTNKLDFKPTDVQVHGLLALERNGQNRTPYVKAMMKRLGLKPEELPGGGPAYTNDLTSITDL